MRPAKYSRNIAIAVELLLVMKRRIFFLLVAGMLARRVCAEPQQSSIRPSGASRFELHVFTGIYGNRRARASEKWSD